MRDPNEFSIVCCRKEIEGERLFEARVLELPDIVGYGKTRAEAERVALEALDGLQELAQERGRSFPEPVSALGDYSGRVTLRLSRSQHRQAALVAAAERVSLNSFICEAVAARLASATSSASGQFVAIVKAKKYAAETPFHIDLRGTHRATSGSDSDYWMFPFLTGLTEERSDELASVTPMVLRKFSSLYQDT